MVIMGPGVMERAVLEEGLHIEGPDAGPFHFLRSAGLFDTL
jgi:hypothetical protein